MRIAFGLVAIGLVAVLAFLFIQQSGPATSATESKVTSGNPAANDTANNKPEQAANQIDAEELSQLEADLEGANTAVELAEAQLDGLSQQLDQIEAQVSDIEARGDDPAEHSDEVMPYMQPVLDEFLDAQAALDEALERQVQATSALKEALARAK